VVDWARGKGLRRFAYEENRGLSLIVSDCLLLLAEFDAETRFRLRAQRGAGKAGRGLDLLDKAAGK
jgi:hypothetical protein